MYLTTLNGKLRLNKCGGVLVESESEEEPCCCPKKICWARSTGTLFSSTSDDLSINSSSDISQCSVIVDYFPNQCPPYSYFPADKVVEFLSKGGVYITNCEWTYCNQNLCDPDGSQFASHMSAIGCSLSRGRGTISTNTVYSPSGAKIFANCSITGNATAEIVGGTPLVSASSGTFCAPAYETGGTQGAGAKTNKGAVIAFGDSNMYISGEIRNNLLNTSVNDLF